MQYWSEQERMKYSRLSFVCAHLCIYMNTAIGFPTSVIEDPEAKKMNENCHKWTKYSKTELPKNFGKSQALGISRSSAVMSIFSSVTVIWIYAHWNIHLPLGILILHSLHFPINLSNHYNLTSKSVNLAFCQHFNAEKKAMIYCGYF